MRRIHIILAAMLTLILSLAAGAAEAQGAVTTQQRRVAVVTYDEDAVYTIVGHPGYTTAVAFGERVNSVSIGDPGAWQVTPVSNNTVLSVKPVEELTETSMTAVGRSGKLYSFRLIARGRFPIEEAITYQVRFRYRDEDAEGLIEFESDERGQFGDPLDPENRPAGLNLEYAYRGDDSLRPVRAYDDGQKTYFRWPAHVRIPAIFSVGEEGRESIVNYTVQGEYFIVHALHKQFTFRDDDLATCIYNLGNRPDSGFDAASPRVLQPGS